jgi:PadR family transcriptional regulator, regulatory protein PadR
MIGELEYLVLTAAQRLMPHAYGAAIRELLRTAGGRDCSAGALYTTLDRLESKGLIDTWMGDPTPERGGRAKRFIQVRPEGVAAAREFHRSVTRLSEGTPWQPRTPRRA